MNTVLDPAAFRRQISPEQVRVLQILFASLAVGVITFAILVAAASFVLSPGEASPEDVELVRWLTLAVLLLMAICGFAWSRIPSWMLTEKRLREAMGRQGHEVPDAAQAEIILAHLRTTEIIRLAVLESAAIFGLVVCVIALTSGVLPTFPTYWVNLVPSVLFLGVVGLTFPSADRLYTLFEQYVVDRESP